MYETNNANKNCHGACFDCDDWANCKNYDAEQTPESFSAELERRARVIEEERKQELFNNLDVCGKDYEQAYVMFIKKRANEIINTYYKLGYEQRRIVKYYYNIRKSFNREDAFYVCGPKKPKNILQFINLLKSDKKKIVDDLVEDIHTFGLGKATGMNKVSYGTNSMFSLDVISAISPSVGKSEISKKYYLKADAISIESLKKENAIKEAFKKFLKESRLICL